MKTLGYLLFTAFVALSCHKPQNNDMAHESTCDEILQDSIIKNTSPIWFYKQEGLPNSKYHPIEDAGFYQLMSKTSSLWSGILWMAS